jgi:uncharacterized protein involved in response to NO
MNTTSQQMRAYRGPALFSYGFRPFFLFGALWAALAVALWLPLLTGSIDLPTALAPLAWHVHELVYGFVPAIAAGFLLTAVPNWTGRLPVVGKPLAAVFALWLAGRVAILMSAYLGMSVAAIIDGSFMLILGAVIGREIVAAGNYHNLRVLAVLAILWAGNVVFHAEAIMNTGTQYGTRTGISATVLLISLIGGRIIPSFTRNWLVQKHRKNLPASFDRFDMLAQGVTAASLLSWIAAPAGTITAAFAFAAGAVNAARLVRWCGHATAAESLVFILHVGFGFIPIGFLLLAAGILVPDIIAPSGALHGWTAGAIGIMTLAVMTRASLGHTGRPLTATRPIQFIYVCAVIAALARIAAAAYVLRDAMLIVSATAWVAAFGGFCVVYGPMLLKPRA